MKCPNCAQENKDSAKACKKCGHDLAMPPAWFPDWRWHMRTLSVIYAIVIVMYLVTSVLLRQLPEPYHLRKIPPELTPWLKR